MTMRWGFKGKRMWREVNFICILVVPRTNIVRNHKYLEGRREIASWSCHPSNWRLFLSQQLFFLHLINNHCFSILCAQWHLSIATFAQIDLWTICDPSYMSLFVFAWNWVLFIVVTSPWYSCKKLSLIEKDSSNRYF